MSDAALHDRRNLLMDDIAETSATAAGYLRLIAEFRWLNNLPGMRYNMKCAVACVRSSLKSFEQLVALENETAGAPDA